MVKQSVLAAATVLGWAVITVGQLPGPAARPAPPKHPYEITAEAGPWCISIQTFFENFEVPRDRDFRPGELDQLLASSPARKRAIGFVTELRTPKEGGGKYVLPAYIFNRGDEERKKEEQRVEAQRRERWELYKKYGMTDEEIARQKFFNKRLAHVQDQYVVLIGGYRDEESAQRDLARIRKLPAPPNQFMNRIQAAWEQSGRRQADNSGYLNPFAWAMVVPNPSGPKVAKPVGPDAEELAKGLVAMNSNNPYSLLKHQGKWSLLVRKYQVPVAVGGLEEKGVRQASASNTDRVYEANAKMAEQLAKILRTPGLDRDAYVLHTHVGSMVTVGIFDSERDPRLLAMQAQLAKLRVDPEQLMSPALPIQVPRLK